PLRVLVIEDDADDALLLRRALGEAGPAGFALAWTHRLSEGLAHLRSHPVDVLLLDLGLPDSRGLETLKAVQQQTPLVPIVVLSGLSDEDLAMEAVQQGAQDYLVKGQVSGSLLARSLRYAVERGRAEQRILHLNAVLRAIRAVNQLIGRERDRQRLIQGVCDELAAATGYRSAWMMIFGPQKGAPLMARAPTAASLGASVEGTPFCLPDCMAAPSGALLRNGQQCGRCRQCALRPGLSAVVIRLEYGSRVFGAVAVVMTEALGCDEDELSLVKEVAGDTAYALHGLDNEAKRQQAETALRQSERKFRAIFDHAGDPLLIYDLSGQLLEVNHSACERLGYGYNELLGMRFTQLCTPDTAMEFEEAVQRLRRRGHDFTEADFRRRNGMLLPVELSSSLIRYNGQAAALTSARDVTTRKRAEEAQRLAAVGQLAAGVAHEFNNVLAGMSARAQVARTLQSAEAWEQLGESVVRLTARGAEIGKNLISFARPGQPQKTAVRLEDQVEMALSVAGRELENAQVSVVRDYLAPPRLVLADAGQVQQVLLNVILNACHAMPEGGTLTVSTLFEPVPCEAGEVVVAVGTQQAVVSAAVQARIVVSIPQSPRERTT
ncbi:MAG: PAS domain S-box protein, partial [Armatimonadota bacterium]